MATPPDATPGLRGIREALSVIGVGAGGHQRGSLARFSYQTSRGFAMSVTVEQATVRVKLTASFAGPGWSADRGDEIEVPLADARRMVARGLARAVDENDRRFTKMTPAELEE